MATPPDKMPSQEKLLVDYIHRLEKHKDGRGVVQVHLSQLRPFNRREQHIRTASGHFEQMVKDMSGQLITLKNSDLFFIFKNVTAQHGCWSSIFSRGAFLRSTDLTVSSGFR